MRVYYLTGDIKNKTDDIYYFDNNSTTLIYDKDVISEINEWLSCGNASNTLHDVGRRARGKVEMCRNIIAHDLLVLPNEIIFTGCATESNNIVLQGVVKHHLSQDNSSKYTLISTSFEHPSVYNIFRQFEENERLEVLYVNPCSDSTDDDYGRIKVDDIEKAIKIAKHKVILLSVMYANNETGAIQDVKEIGNLANRYNIFYHCDATQAIGKFVIHPKMLHMDSFVFSGHKFHGPKGIGALYLNEERKDIAHTIYGGEQEYHIRPGTENVAYIAGMTKALSNIHIDRESKNQKMQTMKNYIVRTLQKYEDIELLGANEKYTLPNTMLLLIKNLGTCNRSLVEELDKKGICISVGSACQTNSGPSHVLTALNIDQKYKANVVRVSISDYTTPAECKYFIENMIKLIRLSRK